VTYARISITLPETLLVAADQRARQFDRSRSWLISEALAKYLAAAEQPTRVARVREAAASNDSAGIGLGEQRLEQLRADLSLSPEQRVLAAERTAGAVARPSARWTGVLTFDRYEDYLAWKRREAAGG
jgi:predicted transcriptional regulator